jgi:NagD protein
MFRAARKELGLNSEQTIVIGDTMDTDIQGGVQLDYRTILVLSGGTKAEDIGRYAFRPDKIVNSINDLHHEDLVREFSESNPGAPQASTLTTAITEKRRKKQAKKRFELQTST